MATAEESKADYIAKMGPALGTQYNELWQEIAALHLTWLEFVELYGTKESRITLLNKAGGGFFGIVQDRLWEAVALHIARLTDPPLSLGRKANLTLLNLPELITDDKVKREIASLCDDALDASEFARDWRNRHIAHRDLALALESGAQPLTPVTKKEVNAALDAFAVVVNAMAKHYLDSETAFRHIARINGAEDLLYVIHDGLEAREDRQKRFAAGDFSAFGERAKDL
jgi:hypothetical protein